MNIPNRIRELEVEMTDWRHDLHAHPEIGFDEHRTGDIVAAKLAAWGIQVYRGLGGTGIVGVLRGRRSVVGGNRTIALRADMDALPMQEANVFAHRSQHPGCMHACGHDGHTTMLLGAAKYLSEANDFAGTVNFIFQPAEEGQGGAKAMIDDGLLERFPCDAIYGIHNQPGMRLGTAQALTGTQLASIDQFTVILRGQSAHGARPHEGVDAVSIASQVVSALNAIPSRQISALETAVISIGQIHGGTADNVLPETVELRGSVRTLKPAIRDLVEELFQRVVHNTAAAQGGTAEIVYRRAYPPTINSAHETGSAARAASAIIGAENVMRDGNPSVAGDDIAFMLERVPGAFIFFGQAGSQRGHVPVHTTSYDFNNDLLPIGASYFVKLIEQELG